MPIIPVNFYDTSWHNDACPSFTNEALGLVLWIDYANREKREIPDGSRFVLAEDGETIAESDDMGEIIAAIEHACGHHIDTGRGVCANCGKAL